MKNLTAIIIFFLFTFSLFAQYDSKGILISTSLGFSKTEAFFTNSSGSNPNIPLPQSVSKTFIASPEISYVASDKFMIGLGYFSSNTENNFTFTSASFINGTTVINNSSTSINTSKTSGLTLHMRYSQSIVSKLIISLKFTYLNLKGEILQDVFSTQSNPNIPSQPNRNLSAFNFGEARFSPSLHYFISKKFGCYIETTGLNLRFSDSRKKNKDTDYNFDLNPSTWRVGLFYFIPTQKTVQE